MIWLDFHTHGIWNLNNLLHQLVRRDVSDKFKTMIKLRLCLFELVGLFLFLNLAFISHVYGYS